MRAIEALELRRAADAVFDAQVEREVRSLLQGLDGPHKLSPRAIEFVCRALRSELALRRSERTPNLELVD
jgi:hypothetical protein